MKEEKNEEKGTRGFKNNGKRKKEKKRTKNEPDEGHGAVMGRCRCAVTQSGLVTAGPELGGPELCGVLMPGPRDLTSPNLYNSK